MAILSVDGDVDGDAAFAADPGEFKDADGTVAVFGGDSEGGGAQNGVADVHVELAVVAGFGGVGGADEVGRVLGIRRVGEGTPGGFRLREPRGWSFEWRDFGAVVQSGFLGVDAAFYVAAVGAVDGKARGGFGGQHGGMAGVADVAVVGASTVVEDEDEGVFDGGLVAVGAHVGGDRVRRAEERECLVDEVGAEVEKQAVGGATRFFPGVGAGERPESVEVRLDGDDAAEDGFGAQFADGEKVAIVAAVVEGGEDLAGVVRDVDEGTRLGAGGGERLVEDDVLAGLEGAGGEVEVRVVGRGNDDEVEVGIVESLIDRAQNAGVGIGGGGFVAAPLDDGGEFEARHGGDERTMKYFARETEPEHRGADGSIHGDYVTGVALRQTIEGRLDGGENGEDFVDSADFEERHNSRTDAGERQAAARFFGRDVVVEQEAEASRVHIRHVGHVDNQSGGLEGAEVVLKAEEVAEGDGAVELEHELSFARPIMRGVGQFSVEHIGEV